MKKIKYSVGAKAVALILLQVSMVVAVLSILVIVFSLDSGKSPVNLISEKEYADSDTYQLDAIKKTYELLQFINYRKELETNGEYNLEKVVDVVNYARNYKISEEILDDGIGYYLGDLLNWSKEGWSYKDVPVYSGGAALEYNEETRIYAEDMVDYDEETIEFKQVLVEKYLPVDGLGIEERAVKYENQITTEEMYNYLEYTLANITNVVLEYKQKVVDFKADNSNVSYFVIDENTVYSNMKDFTSAEQINKVIETMKGMGTYLVVDAGAIEFESNMELNQKEFYGYIENMSIGENEDYIIAMGINTNFPVRDSFYENMINYEKLQPWYALASVGGMVSLLVAFAAFIYLSCAAGRNSIDDKIRLNFFDKVKTEVGAAIVIIPAIFLLAMFFNVLYQRYNNPETYFWVGITAFLENTLFLIGYLSLVRRIKAGTIWKNSLLYGILSLGKKMLYNRKVVTKTLILYGVYVLVTIFLMALTFNESSFGTFLLFVFLIFVGILLIKEGMARQSVVDGVNKIAAGDLDYKIETQKLQGDNRVLAVSINNIRDGLQNAVEASMKNERLKTDLITNVSHDIKTPLTSIINYVDLLKRENIEDEKISNYIAVLDAKSQRLKHLTEDLVEASKVSSGNITLIMEKINFVELVHQTTGEFTEKFAEKKLEIISNLPQESIIVQADGKRLWRVIENIYNNTAKYSMENTRVYIDMIIVGDTVEFSVKNISAQPMNMKAEELTERFIRGDISRSTEGSGLGLSIARDLINLQNGEFAIYVDGDLFKVTIRFKVLLNQQKPPQE